MTTHTITFRPPPSEFTPHPAPTARCVQATNVRADRVRPGDLLLRPAANGTVTVLTVERAVPDRLHEQRVNVHLHNHPSLHLHRADHVTVMRAL